MKKSEPLRFGFGTTVVFMSIQIGCVAAPADHKPQHVVTTLSTLTRQVGMSLTATENHAPAGQHYVYQLVGNDFLGTCSHEAPIVPAPLGGPCYTITDECVSWRKHGAEGTAGWTVAIQYDPTPQTIGGPPPPCGTASIAITESPAASVSRLFQGAHPHANAWGASATCAKFTQAENGYVARAFDCVIGNDIKFLPTQNGSSTGSAGALIAYAATHSGSRITASPSIGAQVGLGPGGNITFSTTPMNALYSAGYRLLCNYRLRQTGTTLFMDEQCSTGYVNKQSEDTSVVGAISGAASPPTDNMWRPVSMVQCPEGSVSGAGAGST